MTFIENKLKFIINTTAREEWQQTIECGTILPTAKPINAAQTSHDHPTWTPPEELTYAHKKPKTKRNQNHLKTKVDPTTPLKISTD